MKERYLLFGILFLLAFPFVLAWGVAAEGRSQPDGSAAKPNIILIFVDDVGYGDLGCYGSSLETPAIDRLAADGWRATDCLVASNVCGPSRAALMTGRYPMRCGHPISRHSTPKYASYGLAADELTIAELLKTAGYFNKMVGKWHLGFHVQGSHPMDAGFDEYLGLHGNYSSKVKDANTLYRDREVLEANVDFEKVTELYTTEIVEFIKKDHSSPFFVYFSHHIAHDPILPSESFQGASRGKRKGTKASSFKDFLLELDDSVQRVRQAVEEAGIAENTMIVFLSDNGPARHGSAKPLTGGKYVTMEGGHRVPAIFLWPEKIPSGHVGDAMITSMDLLPLFCHVAGVELPSDRTIDGKNIVDLLTGETDKSPHEFFYYYNGLNLQAIRQGNWKLHLPRTKADQPYWAKKGGGARKPYLTLNKPLLFDLEKDLAEKSNVLSRQPGVVSELMTESARIRAEIGDVQIIGTDQRPHGLVEPNEKDQ
jgi:arylsulfatase A-like enzyme